MVRNKSIGGLGEPEEIRWEEILPQIESQLCGYIPASDLEDVTQDVVLTALQNLGKFEHSKGRGAGRGRLPAWISGITKFKRLEYYAKTNRRQQVLETAYQRLAGEIPRSPMPHDNLQAEEIIQAIRAAVRECPPSLVRVARPYFEGKCPKQIAKELNFSPATVQKRLSRLRAQLRKALSRSQLAAQDTVTIFQSGVPLSEALARCAKQPTPPVLLRCFRRGEYEALVNRLDCVDHVSRENLSRAANAVTRSEDLSRSDTVFVQQQLMLLVETLGESPARIEEAARCCRRIMEVSPCVAAIISAIPELQGPGK